MAQLPKIKLRAEIPESLKAELAPTRWGKILSITPVVMTVIATMLGACLGSLVFMLTPLLPPGLLQNAVIYSCFIPFMIVYARVVGAALKVNPWVVFGSAALCYLLFVCCCGCGMAVMVGALMTG